MYKYLSVPGMCARCTATTMEGLGMVTYWLGTCACMLYAIVNCVAVLICCCPSCCSWLSKLQPVAFDLAYPRRAMMCNTSSSQCMCVESSLASRLPLHAKAQIEQAAKQASQCYQCFLWPWFHLAWLCVETECMLQCWFHNMHLAFTLTLVCNMQGLIPTCGVMVLFPENKEPFGACAIRPEKNCMPVDLHTACKHIQ
jgi:hypothetical protein